MELYVCIFFSLLSPLMPVSWLSCKTTISILTRMALEISWPGYMTDDFTFSLSISRCTLCSIGRNSQSYAPNPSVLTSSEWGRLHPRCIWTSLGPRGFSQYLLSFLDICTVLLRSELPSIPWIYSFLPVFTVSILVQATLVSEPNQNNSFLGGSPSTFIDFSSLLVVIIEERHALFSRFSSYGF